MSSSFGLFFSSVNSGDHYISSDDLGHASDVTCYSHVAKVLVTEPQPSRQNEELRLHNNHTIEGAVINQIGPLGDRENDCIQVKNCGVVQCAY